MNPERWRQVKEIFHAALEVAPGERGPFLDKACSNDAALRREVESLIASHERTGDFIDSPAYEAAAHLLANDPEALQEGQAVGDYRILRKIGRGGMGEVYLARDQKLGRNVALKVLPLSLSQFTDRLRRFETEACAASALNHPNILTIFGMGQSESRHFIVTEFIEGETLRRRIPKEGMRIEEALEISIQIASALQAAHEAGIIHRDIKPENIMVRVDGYVKVLDFGLAKLAADWRGQGGDAPTRPILKTDSGAVMGTVQYMSPEQARGLSVDARTDIWSFGIVLYEMLSGHAPFDGETSSHTIVSILEDNTPPLREARPDTPQELERIVARALSKQPENRYQSARELLEDLRQLKQRLDFEAELERTASGTKANVSVSEARGLYKEEEDPSTAETVRIEAARNTSALEQLTSSVRRNWRWALLAIAVPLLAFIGVFAIYRYYGGQSNVSNVQQNTNNSPRLPVRLRGKQVTSWAGLDVFPSFSPDGNSIVYSSDHNGSFELYVKQLTPGGREMQLTNDGQQNVQPVWSPDGQRIAYHSNKRGGIWVVPALGGAPKQLSDFGSRPAWSPDSALLAFQSQGVLDFQSNAPGFQPPSTIWTVAASGGTPQQLTQEGSPTGGHGTPSWSPDGRRLVFVSVDMGSTRTRIWTVGRDGSGVKLLTEGMKKPTSNFDPVYAPDGRSVYFTGPTGGRGWAILKLAISPETGEAQGEPSVILETGWIIFRNLRVSADGKRIAYGALEMTSNLWSVHLSAAGEATGQPVALTQDTTFRKSNPAFSPDGKRIAYQKFVVGENHDIWLMDTDGQNQTQLTTAPGSELYPYWFPQGERLAFLYNEQGQPNILRSIDVQTGREETIFSGKLDMGFPALSPDGKTFAFNSTASGVTNVWLLSLDDKEPRQLTFDTNLAGFPHWSPDSQFIVFESRRPDGSHLMLISRDGGEATQITFDKGQTYTGGFSPDGNKITFAGYRNSVWNIWWVTRDGKTEKQVTGNTKLNAFVRYPVWSPLGNQIVFEYAEVKGNIWITDLE